MNRTQALAKLQELRVLDDCDSLIESESDEDEDYENETNDQIAASEDESDEDFEIVDDDAINASIERVLDQTNCTSKDGLKWQKMKKFEETKTRNKIRFNETPGLTILSRTRVTDSILSAFLVIIDYTIIDKIVESTRAEAKINNDKEFTFEREDLLAFIGVLFFKGLYFTKVPTNRMWNEKHGSPLVKSLMSRNRYHSIMKYLRFDDKKTRKERGKDDKFLLIREVWDQFIYNCRRSFTPARCLTIDEQLLACKTRCGFIQYMPNKPDKFGIKFWVLVDLVSKFVCNIIPYLGKGESKNANDLLGESVVKKLMEPLKDRGYFVTTDNFFTTHNLVYDLLDMKTTFLGTVNRNKRELPLAIHKKQEVCETTFFDDQKGCLLTVYQGKPNKTVLLLSSEHEQASIDSSHEKKKPHTILNYNITKCGVHSVDQ